MTGRYKAYPEYKDSGVEWLDQIPSHWKMVKLSYGLKLQSGDTITSAYIKGNGDFPVYGGNGTRGFTSTYNCDGQHVLIGRQGALCGNINLASGKFFASEHAVVVYPSKYWNTKYIAGMLLFMNLGQYSLSAAQPGVSVERLNMLKVIQPPLPEQKQIARFLDHETAKIDCLIAKQQALIALLKEKRQAVISHAVTKGLPSTSSGQGNPNAKMKDSGVEWLGEVPEHWEAASLSMIFNIKAGGDLKAHYFSEERTEAHPYPIYTNANDKEAVYGYTSKACYPPNSVTVSGRGEVGFAVFRDHAYDAIIRLLVLTPIDHANGRFFAYVINEVIDFNAESSAIGQLSTQQIAPYRVDFPKIEEQTEIVEYLDLQTAKIDHLIKKAHEVIALLQERRTALISAAVTGKIDVRDWKPIADVTDD